LTDVEDTLQRESAESSDPQETPLGAQGKKGEHNRLLSDQRLQCGVVLVLLQDMASTAIEVDKPRPLICVKLQLSHTWLDIQGYMQVTG
jgi:hypothetical protein